MLSYDVASSGCLHSYTWIILLLTTLVTFVSANSKQEDVLKCHKTYYNWPRCVDEPNGYYSCDCGPGFYWNTKSCLATSVDSRLEFSAQEPIRYALLQSKPFPTMHNFTIAMWLKVYNHSHPGTVMSYKVQNHMNFVKIMAGPTLRMTLLGKEISTNIRLENNVWAHIAITWNRRDMGQTRQNNVDNHSRSRYYIYVDGRRVYQRTLVIEDDSGMIPDGGEFILGQSSRDRFKKFINPENAFLGEMAFVNLWNGPDQPNITNLMHDCKHYLCGDGVEWVDFRSGTYGAMKIRWPSGIRDSGPCFSPKDARHDCNSYCSAHIGAQCKAEISENILWVRTKAENVAKVPCPGHDFTDNSTEVLYASRVCLLLPRDQGIWSDPDLSQCLNSEESHFQSLLRNITKPNVRLNEKDIHRILRDLGNHTNSTQYRNVIDLAAAIDNVKLLLEAQIKTLSYPTHQRSRQWYLTRPDRFPAYTETKRFAKGVCEILDNLLLDRNDGGWLTAQPRGAEGDQFFKVLEQYFDLIAELLRRNMVKGDFNPTLDYISAMKSKLEFETSILSLNEENPIIFPRLSDEESKSRKKDEGRGILPEMTISPNVFTAYNQTTTLDHIAISLAKLSVSKILPNSNITTRSKEDNVNSEIFVFMMHVDNATNINFTYPVQLHLPYSNDFNISNPECVRLVHGKNSSHWSWSHEGCYLVANSSQYADCACIIPGVFAVTTDMYNVNWDPGIEPMILMQAPSYIGCIISAVLCLISCLLLIYLRTASSTATIHKNFALAIFCSQVTFMVGIDKVHHQLLCQAFAVMFHYFFLATFSWLMNEAFNLYIVITYAAHSHTEHVEGGSQWRYFILGWVFPAILVGAFVGTHTTDYYAPDMCWIAWPYLWLFIGPAIGIISITVLVLIFTAKEVNESSYSKNENTNKMISIHSKALWTQVILLTVCWCFAFLTLRMRGLILKVLYGLFTGLQGAFFCVFYFLLNDEVRAKYLARQKTKSLAKQGYELTPAHSMNSDYEQEMLAMDSDIYPEACTSADDSSMKVRPQYSDTSGANMSAKRRRKRSEIEVSCSEDSTSSECEDQVMITSV